MKASGDFIRGRPMRRVTTDSARQICGSWRSRFDSARGSLLSPWLAVGTILRGCGLESHNGGHQ
jgi:hypothetical protein